jgi:hypothetical protein
MKGLLIVVGALLVAGCGGSQTVGEACDALGSATCGRLMACFSASSAERAQCEASFADACCSGSDCQADVADPDLVAECEDEMRNASCAAWEAALADPNASPPIPAKCYGVAAAG